MGPTIIFDKSSFQSLSLDESIWLDALYLCNITPLFFIETLADLSLDPLGNPEAIVRTLPPRRSPELDHFCSRKMDHIENSVGARQLGVLVCTSAGNDRALSLSRTVSATAPFPVDAVTWRAQHGSRAAQPPSVAREPLTRASTPTVWIRGEWGGRFFVSKPGSFLDSAEVARKTPEMSPSINAHHRAMCLADLHGETIVGDGRPAVAGLAVARTAGGKLGLSMAVPAEQRAFQRWQQGAFREIEHESAQAWRAELSGIDLTAIHSRYRHIVIAATPRPRDLEGIKRLAEQLLRNPGPIGVPDPLWLAFSLIGIPVNSIAPISARWRALGRPPLDEFAPYAAHVVLVDLVFNLALGAELIGRERPSNKVDIGYLYYLPFTMVFTSRDRIHVRMAPLFLRPDQTFVHGDELKSDLARLDRHYSTLPDAEKERGVFLFANRPPESREFLTTRLWDKHLPAWRGNAERETAASERLRSPERDRQVIDELRSIEAIGGNAREQRPRLTGDRNILED